MTATTEKLQTKSAPKKKATRPRPQRQQTTVSLSRSDARSTYKGYFKAGGQSFRVEVDPKLNGILVFEMTGASASKDPITFAGKLLPGKHRAGKRDADRFGELISPKTGATRRINLWDNTQKEKIKVGSRQPSE